MMVQVVTSQLPLQMIQKVSTLLKDKTIMTNKKSRNKLKNNKNKKKKDKDCQDQKELKEGNKKDKI
jgi:hypothetical protein